MNYNPIENKTFFEWMWIINVGETELWRRKDGPAEAYFGILPWMGRAALFEE